MFELKAFQTVAAKQIADRYAFFASHPRRPARGKMLRPFYQELSALTGSGKTAVLAQAVALLRGSFQGEPIVFWISKAKTVVAQTHANFSAGGRYSEILEGFRVITAGQLRPELIADSATPLLVTATTGLFNNKEQADGNLNIYKRDEDLFGEMSPWERLVARMDGTRRRPLVVVYDEGHNLSEQQTEILGELQPDAYLLASATLRRIGNFSRSVIAPIVTWVEEEWASSLQQFEALGAAVAQGQVDAQSFLTTSVKSDKVVEAQLVKRAIQFDGTTSTMERCVSDLLGRLKILTNEAQLIQLQVAPKAIYVCKTNMTDDGDRDDPSLPFDLRKAPPIRIWRHLVESGVDPRSIAIYANLNFLEGTKPDAVNLFSKGDSDYDDFTAGNYQHIIFNQALQEGWDDPACYLAYIDRSMGSSVQVEQVIGRALRQFGATHYSSPLLNAAHFFIRVDNKNVFTECVRAVKDKLSKDGAPIEVHESYASGAAAGIDLGPRLELGVSLAKINVDGEPACTEIQRIIDDFPNFMEGSVDTLGEAHVATQVIDMQHLADAQQDADWRVTGQTNPVRLRWLLNNSLKSRSPGAFAITNLLDPKFDVRVQLQSRAARGVETLARDIVNAYHARAILVYESMSEFRFGVLRSQRNARRFSNSLYESYSGLNTLELECAEALDATGSVWHRNPSSGFCIPLLTEGDTRSFFPDFIVWSKDLVYCLDTKGKHLLTDAVARKLFDVREDGRTRLCVRFITPGHQDDLHSRVSAGGFTVWSLHQGAPRPRKVATMAEAVQEALRP